jgi:hypothetical protein
MAVWNEEGGVSRYPPAGADYSLFLAEGKSSREACFRFSSVPGGRG